MRSGYGQKGGRGPTAGMKAIKYAVDVPGYGIVNKLVYHDRGGGPDGLIATGFMRDNGKPLVVVWPGEPAWEGDFGRLKATKV
jgi:hypothetical protein